MVNPLPNNHGFSQPIKDIVGKEENDGNQYVLILSGKIFVTYNFLSANAFILDLPTIWSFGYMVINIVILQTLRVVPNEGFCKSTI